MATVFAIINEKNGKTLGLYKSIAIAKGTIHQTYCNIPDVEIKYDELHPRKTYCRVLPNNDNFVIEEQEVFEQFDHL